MPERQSLELARASAVPPGAAWARHYACNPAHETDLPRVLVPSRPGALGLEIGRPCFASEPRQPGEANPTSPSKRGHALAHSTCHEVPPEAFARTHLRAIGSARLVERLKPSATEATAARRLQAARFPK